MSTLTRQSAATRRRARYRSKVIGTAAIAVLLLLAGMAGGGVLVLDALFHDAHALVFIVGVDLVLGGLAAAGAVWEARPRRT